MRMTLLLSAAALALAAAVAPASAQSRYSEAPPLVVSPDLAAPWVMQLNRAPSGHAQRQQRRMTMGPAATPMARQRQVEVNYRVQRPATARPDRVQTAALGGAGAMREARPQIDPKYLPQTVDYSGPHGAGTIVIDTKENFLYLIEAGGKARRYGVGTGKPGFEWAGTHKVTRKAEWPDWRPPAEMIAREKKKGRVLPAHMPGGPENPLGARALYLGSTLYRIHGTNQPWTIGGAVSSGCIRMRNEDVMDLYERVKVGTKVIVS